MTIACYFKYFFVFVLAQHCLFSTSAYSLGEDASRTNVDENKVVQRNLQTGTSNNIFQKAGIETLVVGGRTAISDRYPYYAYLKTGERVCGGSLIAPDLVLTAASCRGMARAQIGRNDLFSFTDIYDSLDIIEEFVHPSYDPDDKKGQILIVAGFGHTDNTKTYPSRLQEAELGYFPNDVCSTKSTAEFSMSDKITTDMLCAGSDGTGICSGDSGNPLLALGKSAEEDILVGTVSWGAEPCGELPGVFQRMSESSKWIKDTVCVNSIDAPTGYCPSPAPSFSPAPSVSPTIAPTLSPSGSPSMTPSTSVPSSAPSSLPSYSPSVIPSEAPSRMPSQSPSVIPSDAPSLVPSQSPSISVAPSPSPSSIPSDAPSLVPTISRFPTQSPTMSSAPSVVPSVAPSDSPTDEPTEQPTTMAPSESLVAPTFSPIAYMYGSAESRVDSAWSLGNLSVFRYTSTVVLASTLFQFL